MSYVREKLYQATLSLVGDGDLDQRLAYAAMVLLRVKDDHPFKDQAFKEEFFSMMDVFTKPVDPAPDGSIHANIARMDETRKREIAERIVGMLWQDE